MFKNSEYSKCSELDISENKNSGLESIEIDEDYV